MWYAKFRSNALIKAILLMCMLVWTLIKSSGLCHVCKLFSIKNLHYVIYHAFCLLIRITKILTTLLYKLKYEEILLDDVTGESCRRQTGLTHR